MSDHRCDLGPQCRNAIKTEHGKQGANIDKPDGVCDSCFRHIERCAQNLINDWDSLRINIGETAGGRQEMVRSTRTLALPINVAIEALMSTIVETAECAAAMVSDKLNADPPDGRRGKPPKLGTLAYHCDEQVRPTDRQRLDVSMKMVAHRIDLLLEVGATPIMAWAKPNRCDEHAHLIGHAEALFAFDDEKGTQALIAARALAGECDECGGWGANGQRIELVEQTGLDVALEMVKCHRLTLGHLGLTTKRHFYATPCPAVNANGHYCGQFKVGRNDGESLVTCSACKAQWEEDEYDFLSGLVATQEDEVLRYLLAEAYWRLDGIEKLRGKLENNASIELPGAGTIILDALTPWLSGHQQPEDRKTVSGQKGRKKNNGQENNR